MSERPGDLPPISGLIELLGEQSLLEWLKRSGADREVLHGFRVSTGALRQPVVNRRLQELLAQAVPRRHLAQQWGRWRGELYEALTVLAPVSADADSQQQIAMSQGLVAPAEGTYSEDALQWAILLHPDREQLYSVASELFKRFGERCETLPESDGHETAGSRPGRAEDVDTSGTGAPPAGPVMDRPEPVETQHGARADATSATPDPNASNDAPIIPPVRRGRTLSPTGSSLPGTESASLERKNQELREQVRQVQQRAEKAESDLKSFRRKTERLQRELEEARERAGRAEKQLRKSATPEKSGARPAATRVSTPPALSEITQVIELLLGQGRYRTISELARSVLELDPGRVDAREWLIEALRRGGADEELARVHYDFADQALREKDVRRAVRELCESIGAAPNAGEVRWRIEKLMQVVSPDSREDVSRVAAMYAALKRTAPESSEAFEALARQHRRSLWRRLPSAMQQEIVQSSIEWTSRAGPRSSSARDLAVAVTTGDVETVDDFRGWIARLSPDERPDAMKVVDGANRIARGARRALLGTTRPVVVDGSNVAWYGCSEGARANFDQVRLLREALLDAGYFPVTILADAALPFQVEERERVHRWEIRGDILLVEAGTDADESLVAEAWRLNCPLVTNDRLRDVDPDGTVIRIGYSFGPGGASLHLPESNSVAGRDRGSEVDPARRRR